MVSLVTVIIGAVFNIAILIQNGAGAVQFAQILVLISPEVNAIALAILGFLGFRERAETGKALQDYAQLEQKVAAQAAGQVKA